MDMQVTDLRNYLFKLLYRYARALDGKQLCYTTRVFTEETQDGLIQERRKQM